MWQTEIAEKFKPFHLQANNIATIVASTVVAGVYSVSGAQGD
jgi:hypothetical protein